LSSNEGTAARVALDPVVAISKMQHPTNTDENPANERGEISLTLVTPLS